MRVECRRRGRCHLQALHLEWERLQGDGGPVWQQVPIRQLESASACVAICPLRLTPSHLLLATEGPGAVPQHKGEAPGWEGQAAFRFAFV